MRGDERRQPDGSGHLGADPLDDLLAEARWPEPLPGARERLLATWTSLHARPAQRTWLRPVAVAAASQGDRLRVEVQDDGPGLPAERRAEVVERGRRLDEQVPGSGLGLAIVVDIAELYGGALVLERAALGGLAARLTLPLAR